MTTRRFMRGAVPARMINELKEVLQGWDNLWVDLGAPAGTTPLWNGGANVPLNFTAYTDYGDPGDVAWKPTAIDWCQSGTLMQAIAEGFNVGGWDNGSPWNFSPGIGEFFAWFKGGIPPHTFPAQVSTIDATFSRSTADDGVAGTWLATFQPGGTVGLLRFGCTIPNPAILGAWNPSPDNVGSVSLGPQFNVSGVQADVSGAVRSMPGAVECIEAWVPATFANLQVLEYELDVKPPATGVDGWLRYKVQGYWVEKREYAWNGTGHTLTDEGDNPTTEDLAPTSSGKVSFALMGKRWDSRGAVGPETSSPFGPRVYTQLQSHQYRTLGWGLGSTVASGVRTMVNVKELVDGAIKRGGRSALRDEFLWPTTGGVPLATEDDDAWWRYIEGMIGPRSLEFFALADNKYTWRAQASGRLVEADAFTFDGPILARFRWSDGSVDDMPVPLVYPRM